MNLFFPVRPNPAALAFILAALVLHAQPTHGQSAGGNATSALNQLSSSFSGGQPVQQIQLAGTATWTAGGTQDTGTVGLTVAADGSSNMQLQLDTLGSRTETQTSSGENASCNWTGADGVLHQSDITNCWKPALWFLPAFSFQPQSLLSTLQVVDLGSGQVGSSPDTYRHLQASFYFSDQPGAVAALIAQQSTADLGLDPSSMLPAVLTYSVNPDSGSSSPILMEVHYANYQVVNGVAVPFLIQKFVNGSLLLQINVTSAQIN
jgi:hypothetical protein